MTMIIIYKVIHSSHLYTNYLFVYIYIPCMTLEEKSTLSTASFKSTRKKAYDISSLEKLVNLI